MAVELVRNNLYFLEAKGLGLSQQEKKECFGRQSKLFLAKDVRSHQIEGAKRLNRF